MTPRRTLLLWLLQPVMLLANGPLAADAGSNEIWQAQLESSARAAMQGQLAASEQQLRDLLARTPANQPALQADILHRLQFLLRGRHDNAAAKEAAARALTLRLQAFGSQHLAVAESQLAYARLLAQDGQTAEAEKLLRQSLNTRDALTGSESLAVAEAHHTLGLLYQQLQQHDNAAEHLGRALVIRQKRLPVDHPDILYTQARLGATLQQLQQYPRAIGLLQDALEGETRRGNADGLHAAIIHRELAYCYHYQRRFAEAEPYYQQALTLFALNLGQQHRAYAVTLQALGWLYISDQRDKEGQAMLEQARQLLQQGGQTPPRRQ